MADAGGVLALVSMMNDIDEDEISKKAFTTLTSMGEIAIDVVLGHIAALSIGISGCVGLGEGLLLADGAARPSEDVVDAVEKAAKHAAQYYVEMSKETVRNQQRRRDEYEEGSEEQSKISEWDVHGAGMTGTVTSSGEAASTNGNGDVNGINNHHGNASSNSSTDNIGNTGSTETTTTGENLKPTSKDRSHMSVVWGMLAKLLPVLNGMVYSDGAVREYVWQHGHGMAVLLHVVTRALPLELRVVTVFTLANLTQSHNDMLQQNAARLDAVGVLAALMHEVQRNDLSDSDEDDVVSSHHMRRMRPVSARRSETFCVILQVVHNLVQACRDNVARLVFMEDRPSSGASSPSHRGRANNNLLAFITRCCVDGTEPDLRNEAAGVLLSVVEMAIEEGGPMLRRMLYGADGPSGEHRTNDDEENDDRGTTVLSTLKLLSESFDSDLTKALKARSSQSVRELEELEELNGGSSQKK